MSKQTLILVRGLPGSGKSTRAKRIVDAIMLDNNSTHEAVVCEADKFFERNGSYVFDPLLIQKAHVWCQLQTKSYLRRGYTVVVANTFTQLWEMDAYKTMALEYNVPLRILECKDQFQNIHNVPESTIERMRLRWENLK